MKVNVVASILIRRWLRLVLYTGLIFLFGTVLLTVLAGGAHWAVIVGGIESTAILVLMLSLFVLPIPVYRNFSLLNQLGISRRTFWVTRALLLFLYTVVAALIVLYLAPKISIVDFKITADDLGLPQSSEWWVPFFIISSLTVTTTAMAGGNFLGLFTRSTQFLVIFLAIVVLSLIASNAYIVHLLNTTEMGNAFEAIFGLNNTKNDNPLMTMFSSTVYNLVMLTISYQFNRLLKVRRMA